jgi:transcription elongation factor Elf1
LTSFANPGPDRVIEMSIDKQSSKMAFVCDVCSARFKAEDTDQQPAGVHALWIAAKKRGWHAR